MLLNVLLIFNLVFLLFSPFTLARKPYKVTAFNVKHFCSFQEPPCSSNECRVATHIVAGLYPFNFSKFLIKAYQPLNEDERKELMSIQKLYFTYLMQKLCDDKSKMVDPMHQMDLLWNIDDTDYTLFCDIGSAFAECYLTDISIPVQEFLDSCFIIDNGDIELNMYWLECIYLFKESDNWPLKKLENDPKVLELQLRMQMDQISLSKAKMRSLENQVDPVLGNPKFKSADALERARADFWQDRFDDFHPFSFAGNKDGDDDSFDMPDEDDEEFSRAHNLLLAYVDAVKERKAVKEAAEASASGVNSDTSSGDKDDGVISDYNSFFENLRKSMNIIKSKREAAESVVTSAAARKAPKIPEVKAAVAKKVEKNESALLCTNDALKKIEEYDKILDEQNKGVQLPDAVKIAVKQKLNQ